MKPFDKNFSSGEVIYDPLRHKGHLRCLFCDASIHHRSGTLAIAGSFPGRQAHFVTDPHVEHGVECRLPEREPAHDTRQYDDAKGYRLHINTNTYSDIFNYSAGPYFKDEKGRIKLKDSSLANRRTQSITEVGEVIKFIRRTSPERIHDSLVMLNTRPEPMRWTEFFIRYSQSGAREARFLGLMDRLLCKQFQPAAIEFRGHGLKWDHGLCVKSDPIDAGTLYGKPLKLMPRVIFDDGDQMIPDEKVTDSLRNPGNYLLLGKPLISKPYNEGDYVVRNLNITVTDTRQVVPFDILKLAEQVRRKAARRAYAPALAAE